MQVETDAGSSIERYLVSRSDGFNLDVDEDQYIVSKILYCSIRRAGSFDFESMIEERSWDKLFIRLLVVELVCMYVRIQNNLTRCWLC